MNESNDRYGPVAQVFHWVTAVLVLAAFLYGPGGRETRVYADAMNFDRQLHETLGVTVFLLVIVRVLWRMFDARPDPPQVPRWMDFASKVVQGLLYLLLFALPITAIAGAWFEGHPLTLLGDLHIGPYISVAHDIGARIANVHGWLGDTIMWLAGLHAAAAIFHHVLLRDGVSYQCFHAGFGFVPPLARHAVEHRTGDMWECQPIVRMQSGFCKL